jgi:hypothetical protein
MFPALKKVLSTFLICATCCSAGQIPGDDFLADQVASFTSVRYAVLRSPRSLKSDPIENELDRLGNRGQLIARARSSVLAILATENSCTAWYRQSEPVPSEIFRSLHFVVDISGNEEIFKREGTSGELEYLQPYVAHSRQEVGSGSEIMLNANGAFFKQYARVRYSITPPNSYTNQLVRFLVVGDFPGDTAQARILTLLHEFAHVVGLIPADSGTQSAAFLSVQNTKTVLKNCKLQIELEAKQTREVPQRFLSAATAHHQQSHFFAPMRGSSAIPPRQ